MRKTALICGVSGQDGAYLAKLLLDNNYIVYGSSRDVQSREFSNLVYLGIADQIQYESLALNDFRSVLQVLDKVRPDEIYNLAGQSSVGLSFEQPVETMESISLGTLNLLEAIRFVNKNIKIYNAGSGECFGDTKGVQANEMTPFNPSSPYAVAKSAAYWQIVNYRESYGLYACTGILFNHDSPLRPKRFVTRKIISTAIDISRGISERLILGNINIERDWGWAPDYVEAMWKMLQQEKPDDYVICTGESNSLELFIKSAFSYFGLESDKYLFIDQNLFRPSDHAYGGGDPSKAFNSLGWKAQNKMDDVIRLMIESELKEI